MRQESNKFGDVSKHSEKNAGGHNRTGTPAEEPVQPKRRFQMDKNGFPIFRSGHGPVTEELINRIREEEGI